MRRKQRIRLLSWFTSLVMLLQVFLPAVARAEMETPTREEQLQAKIQRAGTAAYELNARAYLERALLTLLPLASDKPGKGIYALNVQALQADPSFFWDVSRINREEALDQILSLVRDTNSAWTNGGVTDQAGLEGLSDLLLTMRQAAEAALSDARILMGVHNGTIPEQAPAALETGRWQLARNRLLQAEQAFQIAFTELAAGNAQAGGEHFLLTWRKATDALTELGFKLEAGLTTDLDGDGVTDQLEVRFGASPLLADTDGDGLLDLFEITRAAGTLWPHMADSDEDGQSDALEDTDRDGLTNLQEQELGTNPLRKDTDRDSLPDAEEVALGTDPLLADTDSDGLSDAAEGRAGTDPRNPDTDGDGIPDGQDLVTGRVETEAAVVSITGVGDVAGTLSVHSFATEERYQGLPGLASPVVDVTTESPFTTARVELPVDMAQVPNGDTANLRLMYFDPEANIWKAVEGAQGFDAATGRMWADTTHFTMFAVFYVPNWNEFWGVVICEDDRTEFTYIDVALVLDSSGSMAWNDPNGLRKVGAKRLVDALLEQDQAAIVDFDYSGKLYQSLTSDKALLHAAIDRIDDWGGTNISGGVSVGLNQLAGGPQDRGRFMVLLTDGVGTYSHYYTNLAAQLGVTIYTIGLGYDIDIPLLQEIAARTGGTFHHVVNANDLPEIFERVGEEIGGRDTDKDGLTDCEEIKGMRDRSGKLWYSNPQNPDTDADGLSDSEEMNPATPLPAAPQAQMFAAQPLNESDFPVIDHGDGFDEDQLAFKDHLNSYVPSAPEQVQSVVIQRIPDESEPYDPSGERTFLVISDPNRFDTDGDGLDDNAEGELATRPRVADSDRDGLNDHDEILYGTDPYDSDTDDDELSDSYEATHESDGMDPLVPDESLTPEEWLDHFTAGAAAGDMCGFWWTTPCRDTVPFFLGQISGGATSFIPVVGWIVGAIFDIRDTIGSLIKGDWVGAGLGLVGLIPAGGDIVKIAGKAAEFVAKFGKLGKLLKALLMSLSEVATLDGSLVVTPGNMVWLHRERLAVAGAGPPLLASSITDQARELVIEIAAKLNIAGFDELRRLGGDGFLVKLGQMGLDYADVVKALNRLDTEGLFRDYPRMKEFIVAMTTKDSVIRHGTREYKYSIGGRVTINLKKVSRANYYGPIMGHLRGALAEYAAFLKVPGDDLMGVVKHVTANGPDGLKRHGNVVRLIEAKSYSNVSPSVVKDWMTEVDGEWFFDAGRLEDWLRREKGMQLSDLLRDGADELEYHLFTYSDGALGGTLAGLFNSGVQVKVLGGNVPNLKVRLTTSSMSPSEALPTP